MNLTDDLIITCRTTCGCGNKLIPYTKQIETTHYLLTCDPHSDKYNHPLLIAIDKNSPIFEKARKWDELQSRNAHIDFGEWLQDTKLRELIEKDLKDKDYRWDISYNRMLKLLEDSKK